MEVWNTMIVLIEHKEKNKCNSIAPTNNVFCKIIPEESNAISKLFPKWCNSGVASTSSTRETIDFTGFSGHS